MVGFKELERKVGDERIWEDGEALEKIKRKARVMVEAHPRVKEDAVGVKMRIGGGGLGEEEWKRR